MPCHAFASPPSDRFHTERSPTKIRECCLLRQFPKDLRDCNRQIVLLCNQIPTVFQNEKPLCCLLFPLAASTQFCILASCDLLISRLDSRPILLWESARVPVSRPVTQLNVPGNPHSSRLASIVIRAFNTFETGQPDLALFAAVSNACVEAPGTFAL